MDVTFTEIYKSIQPFEWCEIPKFAIITGLNGTGKSQLLELLHATIVNNPQIQQRVTISNEQFQPQDLTYVRGEWELGNSSPYDLARISQEMDNRYNAYINRNHSFGDFTQNARVNASFDALTTKLGVGNFKNVTREEFAHSYPHFLFESERELPQLMSKVFFDYFIDAAQLKTRGKKAAQIREALGVPPWEVFRAILREANLPFSINDPSGINLRDKFQLKLTSTITNSEVQFGDLSSGEKVLISMVFYLYSSREKNVVPRLLLLDEPDAHLHPSMSRQLIDVMKNVLVNQYNVRVIMTTHSPSTVALAPEDAIFTANTDGERIRKVTKDAALKLLTSGVPSFSVNYENRRQVFVESKYDVYFYEKIYRRILAELEPEVSLSFIASGESRTDGNGQPVSNCGQVINITTVLRSAGNKFVWGLVDWDTKNTESDFVKVLGDGTRYAIENYLYDPVLVAALLVREKIVDRAAIGLTANQTFVDLKYFDEEATQKVADFVIARLAEKVMPESGTRISQALLNGIEINVPEWYLQMQGHTLEEKLLETFPQLNALKKNTEDGLKNAVVDLIIDDVPELISADFVTAFRKLQAI